MKFTLSWLKKYLVTNATLDEISKKLTSLGLEVESVKDSSVELAGFKIAQILEAVPHPDADRLRVCKVNTGKEVLQIVCGAPNARAGINVVLAPVGITIPNGGFKIKASKIRGVDSNGMLCSANELGIGGDGEGIIEMPADDKLLGAEFAKVAGLDDPVIEIAITPNRGDCLGVYGIARDLAASGIGNLQKLDIKKVTSSYKSPIAVNIKSDDCPLFIGRHFKNLKNTKSPDWLKNKLEAIGLKSISALVDITNYISYEFGRPLHVYDSSKLSSALTVRLAVNGEKISALNNNEYNLDGEVLVVADDKSPVAIAGVIGGLDSGCTLDTKEVFLEIALFSSDAVSKNGRKLDILTDSRYRFERKVDPAFLNDAAEIASQMILEICGGEASELVIAGKEPSWQRNIKFDFNFTEKLTGIKIEKKQAENILANLGFTVKGDDILVPSWRLDVEGAADIVEEIARVYGYDNIPEIKLPEENGSLVLERTKLQSAKLLLAARGLDEVVTWSFMHSKKAKLFTDINDNMKLLNPISSELDYMRPSIVPNLLEAAAKNSDRGFTNTAFFESGLIYSGSSAAQQNQSLAGIRFGKNKEKNIYGDYRDVDVFDAKGDVIATLSGLNAPVDSLQISSDNIPVYYHPGRAGCLKLGKNILAVFGEIHPNIIKEFGIKHSKAVAFEIFVNNIPVKQKKSNARSKLIISEYQSSSRDFAFLIDDKVSADEILRSVKNSDKNLITSADIFDVYQGKNTPENKKSIAVNISIQAKDRTLSEEELEKVSKSVIENVGKLGGVLRA